MDKSEVKSALCRPFQESEIEWRVGECGKKGDKFWAKCFAYVTNRAIQNRLDEVFGTTGWECRFEPIEGGFLCGIGVRDGDSVVWKWDGAERTDFEALKGGLSGSMKRAAVQWGIGRYLYSLESGFAETFSERVQGGHYARTKEGETFYWIPPQLPAWALPEGSPTSERKYHPVEEPRREEPPEPPKPSRSKKPPCPNCGKGEFVLEEREVKGKFFCWKNPSKNKLGCGHKWSDGDSQQAPESSPVSPVEGLIREMNTKNIVSELEQCYSKIVSAGLTKPETKKLCNMLAEKMVDSCTEVSHFDIAEDCIFGMKKEGNLDNAQYERLITKIQDRRGVVGGVNEMENLF